MDLTDIARWQFGIITVYHFWFVPITIGLSAIVAAYETAWLRTHDPHWLRLTKFFGKLFLINFAIGVVTGIVQEFQFGMNWSDYSRFVGDVFGAPLAIEGLLAFFLESTFLGLWIFGWDRLSRRLHAACIWLVHIGTLLSAYFILAANSWMQHPVGYRFNPRDRPGRADRLRRGALQQGAAGDLPARRRSRRTSPAAHSWSGSPSGRAATRRERRRDRAMYRGRSARISRRAGRRTRRRRERRRPGQDHDRGPADEDGGRRGAVRHRGAGAPFSVFTIGSLDGTQREVRRSRSRACCRSWPPARFDGRGQGDQRAPREVPDGLRPDPGEKYYSPATTRRSSR